MKNVLFIISLIFLLLQSVDGQMLDSSRIKSSQLLYNSYTAKCKKNRTSGRVLLYSGIGMTLFGGIIFANYAGQGFNGPAPVAAETFLFIVGPGTALVSIPFFVAAKKNKAKAALALKGESLTMWNTKPYQSNYTAIALTINL